MRKLILATSLLLLGCTGQQMAQNVSVVVNTGATSAPTEPTSSIPNPEPSSAGLGQPVSLPSSVLPSISPVASAPASVSLNTTAITELFKANVPDPDSVKAYMRTEIKAAEDGFKVRYEASKNNPVEVTKMAADALFLSMNPDLSKALLKVIATEPTPGADCRSLDGCLANIHGTGQPPDFILSVFKADYNTRLRTFSLRDHEQREVTFVRFIGSEAIDVHNPADLVPESPEENEVLSLFLKCINVIDLMSLKTRPAEIPPELKDFFPPAYSKMSAWEIKLVFEVGVWKILPESIYAFNTKQIL